MSESVKEQIIYHFFLINNVNKVPQFSRRFRAQHKLCKIELHRIVYYLYSTKNYTARQL